MPSINIGVLLLVILQIYSISSHDDCSLSEELKQSIKDQEKYVEKITSYVMSGEYAGRTYQDMSDFVHEFPKRTSGSSMLENAINKVVDKLKKDGLDVTTEEVKVPNWVRGIESASIISPFKQVLTLKGLGFSGSTAPDGITAEVIVVKNLKELEVKKADDLKGKIVFINHGFVNYNDASSVRRFGPDKASQLGAVGCLVRSVTPFSLNSPHTGETKFKKGKPIPAAALSLESADNLQYWLDKSDKPVEVFLQMSSHSEHNATSRNVLADLKGSKRPDEQVLISGHIDSWDVGMGALDDAVGVWTSIHVPLVIKALNLPTCIRTIRTALWTSEEVGLIGIADYVKNHQTDLQHISIAFETDLGAYTPKGLKFSGSTKSACILKEITKLLTSINTTEVSHEHSDCCGSDITKFKPYGVPTSEPLMVDNNYFWFHHTEADTPTHIVAKDLDRLVAMYTSVIYVLANLQDNLPREVKSSTHEKTRKNSKLRKF